MANDSATTTTTTAADPAVKGALGVVFLTLFLDLLGFGILIPIQAYFAEGFGASPRVITLLTASYSLMQFLFAPMWGALSDRYGRRPIILTSVAFGGLGFLLFGLAGSLWMLFASRMIAGFGNANLGTVQAVVADVTSGKDRAKGMGMIGAAFGLGFIFGPIIGGLSTWAWGPHAPGFVAAGFAAINWVLAYKRLPETRRAGASSSEARGFLALRSFAHAITLKNVPNLLAIGLLVTTGFALMETSLALFVEHSFVPADLWGQRAGQEQATRLTTFVMLAVGVTAAVVQGGLIGPLRKRLREKVLLIIGGITMVVGFVATGFTDAIPHGFAWMFPGVVAIAAGSGVFNPSASSLLSQSAPEDRQGEVLGVSQSTQALGRIIGPGVCGLLFELSPRHPFLFGAGLIAAGVVVCFTLWQPHESAAA